MAKFSKMERCFLSFFSLDTIQKNRLPNERLSAPPVLRESKSREIARGEEKNSEKKNERSKLKRDARVSQIEDTYIPPLNCHQAVVRVRVTIGSPLDRRAHP